VPTDLALYTYKDQCVCNNEGCPNCTIMYSLNKKGPGEVYSGDLEPLGSQELRVKDELIPIVKLGPGQALLVYASAELGTAKKHAKWQVTSGTSYRNYPKITINHSKCDAGEACVEACPRDVLAIKDGKLFVENLENCMLCRACSDVCKDNAITIGEDETKFVFEFETDGSLTAKEALGKALEILEKMFEEFREGISALEA
jgi:DNA-directed RNA polymerase subunit D